MIQLTRHRTAEAVAELLAGAWSHEPAPLGIHFPALASIVALLVDCGAGPLAWQRIARSPHLNGSPEAATLQQAFRHAALEELRKAEMLRQIARILNSAGVEPLIFKGWAIARHYAAPHLRPFGDFDLCSPPGAHARTLQVLNEAAVAPLDNAHAGYALGQVSIDLGKWPGYAQVDLHADLEKFLMPDLDAIHGRSRRVELDGAVVRIPAEEDHLRLIAIHFLRHGGWRPLWLTDVAALLESVPDRFDWDLCMRSDKRVSRWIACVIALSHRLLGARVDHVPARYRVERPPDWFVGAVLREWGTERFSMRPLKWAMRKPRLIPAELKARWPNPIVATIEAAGEFNGAPRLPFQLRSLGRQGFRRLTGMPAALRIPL